MVSPAASPRLLALDTSTDAMALAACAGARESLVDGAGGAQASAGIIGTALACLAECGFGARDLQAVAFGRGPGAFTGLRTSCAVAQGLALGAGCRVLPIDSLLIVAEDARTQRPREGVVEVGVVMDARIGEIFAGTYLWRPDEGWSVGNAPMLCDPEALAAHWQGRWPALLAGNGLPLIETMAGASDADRVVEVHHRAAALLRLARAAFAAGQGLDPAEALPLYLRDKVALTTAERERRRVAI